MKKLGLDASTTTVGYAFVDGKEIVTMGFIPIQKEDTIRDKVRLTMDMITELDPFEKVEQIYIEDSLSGFMRGRTSQQTIIKLAKFNAVLTYCLEFAYGEIVEVEVTFDGYLPPDENGDTDFKNFEFEDKFKVSWKLTDKIRLYNIGEVSRLQGKEFYKGKIGLEYTF